MGGVYIRGMCSARTVVRVPCHGWIWADIVARKGRPPLAQVRTLSAAGPHFCPGPATVFGLLCILASPVPNKTTDRRRKSHRPGTMRYQTLLGMSIISKNNRVFALSQSKLSTGRTTKKHRSKAAMPFFSLRRDRDSNSGYPFGVYTLSRRAS